MQVGISLTETDTLWHLDIPSTWVAAEDDDQETVKARNEIYEEVTFSLCIIFIID